MPSSRSDAWFVTTQWTVVVHAGANDTTRAREAMGQLFEIYWPPLYAYVRRWGYAAHDAEDLTQAFFVHLLEKGAMAGIGPVKGRFRSFLLAALKNFLVNEHAKSQARKRGGGQIVSFQRDRAETLLGQIASDRLSPERVYEKRWAMTLLEQVHRRLEKEHIQAGKGELFETLRFALAGTRSAVPYAELSTRLNCSEGAVKVMVHRLRQRYREVLRETIASTVGSADEIEDELRYLMRVLSEE